MAFLRRLFCSHRDAIIVRSKRVPERCNDDFNVFEITKRCACGDQAIRSVATLVGGVDGFLRRGGLEPNKWR